MELALGIDLGTSYFKLGLFDSDGRLRGLGRVPVEADRGDGTRCELPVKRFWQALREGVAAALMEARARPSDIRAVSYASQANSFLILDARDTPLTHLILWPDRRADPVDTAITDLWQRDDFLETTGFRIESSEFCIVKLRWLQMREPETWRRVRRVMTISDYLTFALTGERVGDEGTASLLGLWNLRRHAWWPEALDAVGMRPDQLSSPLTPGTTVRPITATGAEKLGLETGVPFAVGGLDHHVAAIGAGLGRLAPVSESTGTVLAAVRPMREYRVKTGCCVGPGTDKSSYFQLAFDANGAAALEWYRQTYAAEISMDELIVLAGNISPGSDELMARPCADRFRGLEGFLNAHNAHGHGHYARAIMESVAFSLAGLLETLCDGTRPARVVSTGGGARSALWLQIKADMIGAKFVMAGCAESACLGAGIFASIAAGWYPAVDAAMSAMASSGRVFVPEGAARKAYRQWQDKYRKSCLGSNARFMND